MKSYQILIYEGIGFGTIIVSSIISHINHSTRNDTNVITITSIVAVMTMISTWRIIKRLHHLEHYFKLCAWCRKVGDNDKWISFEEYMKENLNVRTTHGICPDCSDDLYRKEEP